MDGGKVSRGECGDAKGIRGRDAALDTEKSAFATTRDIEMGLEVACFYCLIGKNTRVIMAMRRKHHPRRLLFKENADATQNH